MDPVLQMLQNSMAPYWWIWLLTAVVAYLIGSINPAVIVTRVFTKGKKDIREQLKQRILPFDMYHVGH